MIYLNKIRIFFINGVILTITSLILRTIGVSFNVYISNKIGTEAIGVYQLVMSIYMLTITLATSGINLACMRIVSEELACNLEKNIKKAVSKCLVYSLFFGIFSCIILLISAPFISQTCLHNKISEIPFYVIAISLPFVSMSSCINGYFSAVRRVIKNASIQIFEQILKIIIISYLLNVFMPSGIDFACLSLVLGTTFSEIISFFCSYILYIFDKNRYKCSKNISQKFSKKILNISLPIAFTSYVRSGLSTLKQILIPIQLEKSGMSCGYSLSSYGIINGMVMPLILFPSTIINSFSILLIPEFSYYNIKNETQKINNIISRIFKYIFIFSICISGIFLCFSDELSVIIYKNINVSKFIKLLCPLIIFMYIDTVVDSILKGLDKQTSVIGINILDLLISISFIYFILPVYSIYGYICVIFISEIINSILSCKELFNSIHFKINYINWIFKPIFSCFLSILFINLFINTSTISITLLIINIFMFIIIYLIFLNFMGVLSRKDLKF